VRAYLTNWLYNDVSAPPAEPERRTLDDLEQSLAESPQGTLIAAITPQGAARFRTWLTENDLTDRVDAYIGRWPDDERAYNAICLCPVGAPPKNYRRLVLWDLPPEGLALDHVSAPPLWAVEQISPPELTWRSDLPDLDALRALYRSLRGMERVSRQTMGRLYEDIAAATGQSVVRAMAGVRVLERLELVTLGDVPPSLTVETAQKRNPEDDVLFRRMQVMRQEAGGLPSIPR